EVWLSESSGSIEYIVTSIEACCSAPFSCCLPPRDFPLLSSPPSFSCEDRPFSSWLCALSVSLSNTRSFSSWLCALSVSLSNTRSFSSWLCALSNTTSVTFLLSSAPLFPSFFSLTKDVPLPPGLGGWS
ncbi:hypothetical protein J4Q44_G00025570, partial [Coregonus suidteri]